MKAVSACSARVGRRSPFETVCIFCYESVEDTVPTCRTFQAVPLLEIST